MKNESGIQPVEFKVLVKVDELEEVTEGGIIIPEDVRAKEALAIANATLIAVGGNAFTEPNWKGLIPQPGMRVIIAKYSGNLLKGSDGVEYRLCSDKDIAAILGEFNE